MACIEFQAEVERNGRTSIIDVIAYGDAWGNGHVRVALLEWTPGIKLTDGEQAHLMQSAKWRMTPSEVAR